MVEIIGAGNSQWHTKSVLTAAEWSNMLFLKKKKDNNIISSSIINVPIIRLI